MRVWGVAALAAVGIWLLACDDSGTPPVVDAARPPDAFGLPDAAPPVDAAVAPGAFGTPCERSADCLSGYCVRDALGERVCSRLCDEDADCPEAWICGRVNNAGADVTFICLPDEGPCPGVDTQRDPEHCGACDQACRYPNAAGRCADGVCALGACAAGFFDLNGRPEDGCEYACTITRGGVEACDEIDNDCDGATDEGFDLAADVEHCGGCGRRCQLPNATPVCEAGACAVGACAPGFVDRDAMPETGCEAGACAPSNGGAEACDGLDNDCDGATDEGFDLATDAAHCGACGAACAFPGGVAACADSVCALSACQPAFHDLDGEAANGCEYACVDRGAEVCNGVDDDCDGSADEGFDLVGDPSHCGACGAVCARPGAMTRCAEGVCGLAGCADGFVDLDGDFENGCEYACARDGDERCDGADTDCDGRVDEGFDLDRDPSHCGRCDRACAFENATPLCAEGDCAMGACEAAWVDANGDWRDGCEYRCVPTGPLELCNDLDDDCDGAFDEGFDLRVDPAHCGACGVVCEAANATPICVAGVCGVGPCAPGFVDADGRAENGCECAAAGPEVCDGVDQDCDGRVDEAFDLSGDPSNCGACGRECAYAQGEALCVAGACRLGDCEAPFVDADGDPETGCECAPRPEVCDGADDDCDGRVDEAFDLQSDPQRCGACDVACAYENAEPLCVAGACRMGDCAAPFVDADADPATGCECAPQGAEVCNAADDDCDGRVDEAFDFQDDGANCGGCGRDCTRPNAWTHCVRGGCSLRFCDDGFVDANRRLDDGCEVECAVNGAGVPACEGGAAFDGRWDLVPDPIYSCFDFLGEEAFHIHVPVTVFSTAGGTLTADGFPTALSQRPVPEGDAFELTGARGGGDLDCVERYVLRGTFDGADRWEGNLAISFEGLACGLTDCVDQFVQVTGGRLPAQ